MFRARLGSGAAAINGDHLGANVVGVGRLGVVGVGRLPGQVHRQPF
jgi:hypothetical protein